MENETKIVEYHSIRVLTTQQIAKAYETSTDTITKNFNRNKDRYTEGKHYIALEGAEKNEFIDLGQIDRGLKNAKTLYLWTKKGAFLHAKSLNTDKAWEVYDKLVDSYFQEEDKQVELQELPPEMQMFKKLWDMQANSYLEQKRQAEQLQKLEDKTNKQTEALQTVKDTFSNSGSEEETTQWVNKCINKIAESSNFTYSFGNRYSAARNESYSRLTLKAGCRLDQKVRNAIERAEEKGYTKAQINSINKLSVIMADKRLKEIYISVIKEMMIAFCVEVA